MLSSLSLCGGRDRCGVCCGILKFYYHEKVTKTKSEDLGFNLIEDDLGHVAESQFLPSAKWDKAPLSPHLWTAESMVQGNGCKVLSDNKSCSQHENVCHT